jgi:translation initiation factor eIF-2B subunit gamma
MGISDIYLVAPAESKAALEAALSQNPHLTSLPSPRPTLLAPKSLTTTSGTADVFRIPEIREVITTDFIVLPCDLVSELSGLTLLQEWMVMQAGFGGATGGKDEVTGTFLPMTASGEKIGRRGGLGVWYETKMENWIKDEQTDFIATVPCAKAIIPPSKLSLREDISQLVLSLTTDSLNDKVEGDKGLRLRHSLIKKMRHINIRTTMRDAHIYIFPHWILEFMQNEHYESVGEDVLGWWAKATWQDGLPEKLGLDKILKSPTSTPEDTQNGSTLVEPAVAEVNVADYISTRTRTVSEKTGVPLASRTHTSIHLPPAIKIPPMLAYLQPSTASSPFIRRVDTTPALLAVSLRLAQLTESSSSLAYPQKVASTSTISQQTRVEEATCLVADNVTIGSKCNIKETVIGAGCTIKEGARLIKCLLMEDVVIGENVSLSGCVVGPRCRIEGGARSSEDKTDLRDCEIQGGYVVPWGTEGKNEKLMVSNFQSLEGGDEFEAPIEAFEDDGFSHR